MSCFGRMERGFAMDEMEAVNLAIDSAATLKEIAKDVAQIRETGFKTLETLGRLEAEEVPQPDGEEAANLAPAEPAADDGGWVTEVHSSVEVPSGFFGDLMSFQYMQTVLLVFLLLAFLLNLGATLWLAFSDKWRS